MRIAGFCGIREGTVRRARKLLGDAVITDRRHFDHGEGFAHGVRSWRCRRARGLRRVTVPPKVMRRMQLRHWECMRDTGRYDVEEVYGALLCELDGA